MKVRYLAPARRELELALAYYADIDPALAADRLRSEDIVILAFAHQHRQPDYWRSRTSQVG